MEIVIKRKKYLVCEEIDDSSYHATYKNKDFFIKKYDPNSKEFEHFLNTHRLLMHSGVNVAKIYKIDKKSGFVVEQYLKGETIESLIIKGPLDESIYEQVFAMNWYAKNSRMRLDFSIDKWILVNNKLYYLSYKNEVYEKKKDFTQVEVYLWFYTKNLVQYLKKKGLPIDENRLKGEYDTTLEILKMITKYYR